MIIVALHGPMGSGKSTMANEIKIAFQLHGRTVAIVPFAKPLKDAARALGWNGEKDAKGRRLLQLLGTEIGRNCISEHIWTDKWLADILFMDADVVICDDLRFATEYNVINKLSQYKIVFVKIKGRGYQKGIWHRIKTFFGFIHASEKQMPDYLFHRVYDNSGKAHTMYDFADDLFQETK